MQQTAQSKRREHFIGVTAPLPKVLMVLGHDSDTRVRPQSDMEVTAITGSSVQGPRIKKLMYHLVIIRIMVGRLITW
jgi:hypothetical protein